MTKEAIAELLNPTELRVGINLGNILLVTGEKPNGDPEGIAPDMAAGIAEKLGVNVVYDTFATPGEVADAAERGEWDIGLIAIEPKRAEVIDFCNAYVQIEATYLVPDDSPFQKVEDVDADGVRIAVSERAAYDLYLSRTLQHAELVRAQGLPGAFELFKREKLDALAGLVPALRDNAADMPGTRLLPGRYTAVKQAIGTRHGKPALKEIVQAFIADAVASGHVQGLIDTHGVTGKLAVATDD
ncbi:MAG: transporter substrate-binding domain-containing protein [Rhodospirillales bacterium]